MPKVVIYSTPTCHYCQVAKEFFKSHDVSYTEHNVMEDKARRAKMVELTGKMSVPVIVIGRKVVVGFDEENITKLLNLKSGRE